MSPMLRSNSSRFHVGGALSGVLLAAVLFACASSAPRDESAASSSMSAIQDVLVESGGEMSRVTLLGPEEPIFTAFQQSDPERLIIDLAGIQTEMPSEPIPVYDGTVQEISVAPFATGSGEMMTRVEIGLAGGVDYDVRPGQGGLVIEVSSLSDMTSIEDAGTDDVPADVRWQVVADERSDPVIPRR